MPFEVDEQVIVRGAQLFSYAHDVVKSLYIDSYIRLEIKFWCFQKFLHLSSGVSLFF